VTVWREGRVHRMSFERGDRARELAVIGTTDRTGTQVVFKPDPQIFSTTEIQYELIERRLREIAYLMGTRGLSIDLFDERTGAREHFEFPEGLRTFVEHVNKNKGPLHPDIVHFEKAVPSPESPDREYVVELAMQYTDTYQETVYTFVNNINTQG